MADTDLSSINDYFRGTKAVNADSRAQQNRWNDWYAGLSWFQKTQDSTYDDARAKRDAFNLSNVSSAAEKANVERVQSTGLRSEDVEGSLAQKLGLKSSAKDEVRPATKPAVTRPTLRKGSKGASVMDWQKIVGVTADGGFGSGTEKATIIWQKAHGLTADGVVGPKSWMASMVVDSSPAPIPVAVHDSTGELPSGHAVEQKKVMVAHVKKTAPTKTTTSGKTETKTEKVAIKPKVKKVFEAGITSVQGMSTGAKVGIVAGFTVAGLAVANAFKKG